MDQKKLFVTGKYTSSTGIWKVSVTRDGRKATAKGSSMLAAHQAAVAALALMEKLSMATIAGDPLLFPR